MITRDQILQQLAALQAQEQALAQEIEAQTTQLTLTRGAVQMLEHLIDLDDTGAAEVAPAQEADSA